MKKTITVLCLLVCCLTGCRADPPEPPPETVWTTQETEKAVPVPSKNNVPLRTADQVEVPVTEFDAFVLREIQPYDLEQESLEDMRYLIPLPSGNWICAVTDSIIYDKNMDYQYIPKMYGYIDKGGYFKLPYDPYGRDKWYQTLILEMTDGTNICNLDKRAEGYGTFINGVKVNDDYIRIVPEIGEMIYEDYYIGAKVGCAYLTQAATCGLWDAHTVKYALYHEYEKLTEAKYLEIFRTEGAFVAVYKTKEELFMTDILDDHGEVLRTEVGDTSGQYPKIPYVTYKSYEVCQDTETELYYYAKEDGQPFCEPMFTYCTRISEAGTAIVKYEEKLCVLEVKPEPEPETVMYFGIRYADVDPPYQYMEEDTLPDFLTEEQKILYRQAASIFPIFTEEPVLINRFYEWEAGVESVGSKLVQLGNGGYYSAVYGKYEMWDDFIRMVLSVFTKTYYEELNSRYSVDIPLFTEVDGVTYAFASTRTFDPATEIIPAEYELTKDTDTEIVIKVNTGYRYEEENGYRIDPVTYEVKMVNTEEGWRFSQFNSFMNCVLSNSMTG